MVGRGHYRPQQAGTEQFGAVLHTIELFGRPDAVQVVHERRL